MPDFGIFRGFNDKLFGNKLYAGQLPTQLGKIGSQSFGYTFLLDSYPNAAAAYSLRKLRSAYTGSAIRVRNSSNSEADIGFANNILDTASLLTHCGSGNGFVTRWYDQSGNARNATQTTAADQPQIVSSGSVITENGKPALKPVSGINLQTSINLSNNTCVFHVGTRGSLTSNYYIDNQGDTNGKYYWYQVYNGTGPTQNLSGSPSYFVNSNQFTGTTNGDAYNFNGNNQNILSVINANLSTWSQYYFQYFASNTYLYIQERIIYTFDQSSNRTGIESNINTYYGIY